MPANTISYIQCKIKNAESVGLSHDFIRQIESEKARYNFLVIPFIEFPLL